jgi:hypothetical protein
MRVIGVYIFIKISAGADLSCLKIHQTKKRTTNAVGARVDDVGWVGLYGRPLWFA